MTRPLFLPWLQKSTRLLRSEDGTYLVEFSLTLTLLLSVMMGIMGMSMLAYAKHFVTFAARQGTRYAMVRGSTSASTACGSGVAFNCQTSTADVSNFVKAQVPLGLSPQLTTVSTTWSGLSPTGLGCLLLNGKNSPGCVVQVTVSYGFQFGLPFLPTGVTTVQSTSAAIIMR